MAVTATSRTATYKGKSYRLAWIGQTKYGERAKLAFFDGSREFWVDATKVQVSEGRSGGRGRMGPGHGSAAQVAGYSSYCTDRPGCGCYDCAS